ncbi:MAG: hypothetical protein LC667_16455 [Thioalkalivibrio sp.]|nr:hypothetical protein [Thioalkalivibrio sp.]
MDTESQQSNSNKKGLTLEKGLAIAAICASFVVPTATAFIAATYADVSAKRDASVRFVELAVQVLQEAPKANTVDIRSWAVDVLGRNSGVPFNAAARLALTDSIGLPDTPPGLMLTTGSEPGRYAVIACARNRSMCDTSWVVVTNEPTVISLVLNPSRIVTRVAADIQFLVATTWTDGVPRSPEVHFSATGGVITPTGLYTAGMSPGVYRVIASTRGGLADTSVVQITQ